MEDKELDIDSREWPAIPEDIASQISDKQLRDMKKAFMLFDSDGGGTISKLELAHVMETLGQEAHSSSLQTLMQNADADGSVLRSFS